MKVIPPAQLLDANLLSSTVAETDGVDGPEWSNQAYPAGSIVRRTSTHRRYEAAVAVPVGTAAPEDDVRAAVPKWIDLGSTNRWRMLRTDSNAKTTAPSPLTVIIQLDRRIQAVGMTGLDADRVTVRTDAGYVATQALIERGTRSWGDYFFAPLEFRDTALFLDIPRSSTPRVTITLERDNGGPVSCGPLVVGNPIDLGGALSGARVSGRDFSTVSRDAFGGASLLPRKSVPKTSQRTMFRKDQLDTIRKAMQSLRATAAMWFGIENPNSDYFASLAVLGLVTSWDISLDLNNHAYLSLDLEGY